MRHPHPSQPSLLIGPSSHRSHPSSRSPRLMLAMWGVVTGLVGLVFCFSPRTVNVIHIQGDDVSLSAAGEFEQYRQQHCEVSSEQSQIGDIAVLMAFADKPKLLSQAKITSLPKRRNQCRSLNQPLTGVGRRRGTSLILLLQEIDRVVQGMRKSHLNHPVVVTVTLHATEPGQFQPNPHDLKQVQALVAAIVQARGSLVIVGPADELLAELFNALQEIPNAQVCQIERLQSCVEQAFQTGRALPTS